MITDHAAVYEVMFRGTVVLDEAIAAFEGLSVVQTEEGLTVCGRLPDQAAVHGVLCRGRQIGLELVAMHRLRPEIQAPA
jgi:hypothetical protein